jgi:hypothetical protein
VQTRRGGAQTHLMVRTSATGEPAPPGWESHSVSLEEMVMAYLRAPGGRAPGESAAGGSVSGGSPPGAEAVFAGPALVQSAQSTEVVQ